MLTENPTIGKIFDPARRSQRFDRYQRDPSPRGRSLYLNQILLKLKKAFPEHKDTISMAITEIQRGQVIDEAAQRNAVVKSLASFAATVEEIEGDTGLKRSQIRDILQKLVITGDVREEACPVSPSDPRQNRFFLN